MDKASRKLVVNAPETFATVMTEMEADTAAQPQYLGQYDFVQVFATAQTDLKQLVATYRAAGQHDCLFWACYPKGTGRIKSDIKRETVWLAFDAVGLEAVSQISLDDTWSALRARPKGR